MRGKCFVERFRSKNALVPHPTNGMKPLAAATMHPRIKRLLGAPFEFVAEVCRLTEGRVVLVVALYIYRRVMVCNSRTVTLPSSELSELGLARQDKQRALARLQQAKLVELVKVKGRTTQVTLTWDVTPKRLCVIPRCLRPLFSPLR